jgi:glycosyltransferase involved in cell wall biosynthesis
MLLNAAILQAPVWTVGRWAGTGWRGDSPAAELVDEPLRLLHIVPTYLPAVRYGGPIRSVHALCRALAAAGHDVHVFTTSVDGPADSDVPIARPVDLEGVKVTYFPSGLLRRLYWSPPMRRALAASVGGFDVVHLHAVYLWPIWAGARAARAHGVPYVISPRGMLVPELMRRKSRWVKAAWIALIERTNLEAAAAIHATSSVEAGHLSGFGWKLPPIATIPHGVDDPPPPSAAPLSSDIAAATAQGPLVLAFGRISWEKGLDRLIAALPQTPTARLVVAGDAADGYAASLVAQARAGGVDGRVTIVARHVEGADKEALFGAARMLAMPSLSENFGIAALEAMRRGVPVLTTPDVGMSEIVRASGAGRVVDVAPASIAAGINAILDDPAGSRAMGEAGRAHVVAHYGWPSVARRMADLYGSVAKRQESGGARP